MLIAENEYEQAVQGRNCKEASKGENSPFAEHAALIGCSACRVPS